MPGVDLLARGLRAGRCMRHAVLRVFSTIAIGVALATVAPIASADTPHLLLDLNAYSNPINSEPLPLGAVGGTYLFGARTSQPGSPTASGLFSTDFTAAGTITLESFDGEGVVDSSPQPRLLVAGGRAYFVARETASGEAVWVTDGTASGTQKVADLDGAGSNIVRMLGLLGNDLIFIQRNANGGGQLYRTNGTSGGTQALTNLPADDFPSGEALFVNGKIYFVAKQWAYPGYALWVSDGTPGGTHAIPGARHLPFGEMRSSLTLLGSSLLFIAQHSTMGLEVHRLDLADDSVTVIDLNPAGSGVLERTRIVALNGFALFVGTNQNPFTDGFELWRTDGTLAGTSRVLDLNPGAPGAFDDARPLVMERLGDRVLFTAQSTNGIQLWSTDGTAGNTVSLTATLGTLGSQITYLGGTGSYAYFSSPDPGVLFGDSPHRVIVTDGTVAGTKTPMMGSMRQSDVPWLRFAGDDNVVYIKALLFDPVRAWSYALYKYEPAANQRTLLGLLPWNGYNDPAPLGLNGDRVLFSAYDAQSGLEPHVTDAGGTSFSMLKNIAPEIVTNSANPSMLFEFNGKLLFAADDGVHGTEPWQSDGTAAGTSLLGDFTPGAASTAIDMPYVWNGATYLFASDGAGSNVFMRWDGATAQTLAQISAPPLFSGPTLLCGRRTYAELGSKLYFAAVDAQGDIELWVTDGTPQGTARAVDVRPGLSSSFPCGLTTFKNRLYFRAEGDNFEGAELWSSDGTPAGTARVADLNPGAASSSPNVRLVFNNELYFSAVTASGLQLLKSDGTAAGTRPLIDTPAGQTPMALSAVAIVNGRLLLYRLINTTTPARSEVWVSDGTSAGTVRLSGIEVPATSSVVPQVVGNLAYFFASSANGGLEPWVTDGTQAGTRMLGDLTPNGDPARVWTVNFRGVVMFATTDSTNGARLWRVDGTGAGIAALGSIPAGWDTFFAAGQSLYFAVGDPVLGRELYVLNNERPLAGNDSGSAANGANVSLTVLANDSDLDGTIDGASVRIVTAPAHGTATVGANGAITYVPTAGYGGTDSFTYSVADNQGYASSPATVTLTVTAAPGSGGSGGGGSSGGGGGGALGFLELMGLLGCLGVGWHRARRGRVTSVG